MISLFWKNLSDGCGETNCDSMQNGAITFIFINKETFSFTVSSSFFFLDLSTFADTDYSKDALCSL